MKSNAKPSYLGRGRLDPAFFTALEEGGQIPRASTDEEMREVLEPLRPLSFLKITNVHANRISWEDSIYVRMYCAGSVVDEERMETG
jgi:hypothetical protein